MLERELDDLLELLFVDAVDESGQAGLSCVHLRYHVVGGDCLHVAVEVIDRGHAGLDGVYQPNVGGHMAAKCQPDLLGDLDHVVPGLQGNSRMDLLKVVAAFLVGANEPLRCRRIRRRAPVDRRRGDVEVGSELLTASEVLGERNLVVGAEHATDRGYPVCDVEEEDVFDGFAGRVGARRYVRVHLGEPGREILPGSVNDGGSVPDHDVARWADLGDHAIDDNDRMVREHGLSVHR